MPIQRPDWTTSPGTAVVPAAERTPAQDRGPARPDWGPRTDGPRETSGLAVSRTPEQQAPRPPVARSADGRIIRPNWGVLPAAAEEAETADEADDEADDNDGEQEAE